MVISKNRGKPPNSSILIGFSIINHPFWGTPIFGNTPMDLYLLLGGGVSQVMTQNVFFLRPKARPI